MQKVVLGEQLTLDGGRREVIIRYRFEQPASVIRAWLEERQETCVVCNRIGYRDVDRDRPYALRAVEVYESPWDEEPTILYAHDSVCPDGYFESCIEALSTPSWSDFYYEFCDGCYRDIVLRNPRNGWHLFFRYTDEGTFCLRCVEETLLAEGVRGFPSILDGLAHHTVPELFGMFFDDDDLEDAGYRDVDEVFVGSEATARKVADTVVDWYLKGYDVIIAYERMAIGGLEGTVSIWVRERADKPDRCRACGRVTDNIVNLPLKAFGSEPIGCQRCSGQSGEVGS